MCGIAGVWPARAPFDLEHATQAMVAALRHRGPNAQGFWTEASGKLALGHARLSILDVSPAGAQPMASSSGRYTLVFNGEIYNHQKLRKSLQSQAAAPRWKGHSDTETLLACIEHLGLEETLRAAHGMFAVALWDAKNAKLSLARDRFGEKPLYWTVGPRGLAFASELKALVKSGIIDRTLSMNAAASLLRYNNIPAPHTVYENVYKAEPGCILQFSSPTRLDQSHPYWTLFDAWSKGKDAPFAGSATDAVNEVESRLLSVVEGQMLSDVPLGAFLSGGIDSSLIVALMQRISNRPVRTFSIGFSEQQYNEAESAKTIARHLGTEHHELYVTPRDALDIIPQLADIYCEPFADSSQIPTYLVARFARQSVTVALTGDGGDEVFGGYNRYLFGSRVYPRLMRLPLQARVLASTLLSSLRPNQWDMIGRNVRDFFPSAWRFQDPGDKISKLARALPARNAAELYESLLYQWWPDPCAAVKGASDSLTSSRWDAEPLARMNFLEQMMAQDALAYLPNDILVKVDRATMAASIEGRVPFLDHGLYEFAASLPAAMKVREGETKWLLKQVLDRYVPRALVDRAKTGFGVPIERWLRGELRDWAESLLSKDAIQAVGVFDADAVRAAWTTHLSGSKNLQHPLWCVLMYQSWHQRWSEQT